MNLSRVFVAMLLCSKVMLEGGIGLADAPGNTVLQVGHEPKNSLGFGEFSCETIASYVKKIESAGCLNGSGSEIVCDAMRTAVNIQNWGDRDPVSNGISGLKGARISLWRFEEMSGIALSGAGPLRVRALSSDSDSEKIMRMSPVRAVPPAEGIFEVFATGIDIRSNAHYCDWLAGKIELSFEADVPVTPAPMSEQERQQYWRAYEVAQSAQSDLRGESKALFQGYLFMSSLSEPLISLAGGVASLVSSIFFELEVPRLQTFEDSMDLVGYIRFERPSSSEKVRIVLEAQQ